jgi:hypothetical protein
MPHMPHLEREAQHPRDMPQINARTKGNINYKYDVKNIGKQINLQMMLKDRIRSMGVNAVSVP